MDTIRATTVAPRRSALRTALTLDAGVTAANGAAYLALAGPLHDLLGLSEGLLRSAGAFLLVYASAAGAGPASPAGPRGGPRRRHRVRRVPARRPRAHGGSVAWRS